MKTDMKKDATRLTNKANQPVGMDVEKGQFYFMARYGWAHFKSPLESWETSHISLFSNNAIGQCPWELFRRFFLTKVLDPDFPIAAA